MRSYPAFRRGPDRPDLFGPGAPMSPHAEPARRAIADLHDRDPGFVLLADKKLLWQGDAKPRPALEAVLRFPEFGFIHWMARNTALYADRAQPLRHDL